MLLMCAFHRLFGDGKLRGNNLVRAPRRDVLQYFDFALRESVIGVMLGNFGTRHRVAKKLERGTVLTRALRVF